MDVLELQKPIATSSLRLHVIKPTGKVLRLGQREELRPWELRRIFEHMRPRARSARRA